MATTYIEQTIQKIFIFIHFNFYFFMEDIFEQQHYEFVNSEDYFQYIKEMFEYEEKLALQSEI